MAVALVQHQGRGLSLELGGKRTSLLAHQTPLSRQGLSPKSVSGITNCPSKLAIGRSLPVSDPMQMLSPVKCNQVVK